MKSLPPLLLVIGATLLHLSSSKIAKMPKARKVFHSVYKKSSENASVSESSIWSNNARETKTSSVPTLDNRVETSASDEQQELPEPSRQKADEPEAAVGEATSDEKQERLANDRVAGAKSCVAFCLEEGRSEETNAEACESAVCDTLAQLFRSRGLTPPVERCYRVCQLQARDACRRYCLSFFGVDY